jgi:hypothetical protein
MFGRATVVSSDKLYRVPQHAALGVDIGDSPLRTLLHLLTEAAQVSRHRPGNADYDRIGSHRPVDSHEGNTQADSEAGRGCNQLMSTNHVAIQT